MPYKTAVVCLNGHIFTRDIETISSHETISHCPQCGLKLVSTCIHCNSPLHGFKVQNNGMMIDSNSPPDAYCYNCGQPYPWTESALENAELIINEMDCLSDTEREKLCLSFKDLMQETPKTNYAILLAKKALAASKGILKQAFCDLLISSCCESVKKQLGI